MKNTISMMLWKSYLFMVVMAMMLVIVPYAICAIFSKKLAQIENDRECKAIDLMQDDYQSIDVSEVKALKGSVQVVTKQLKVITLCGRDVIGKNVLTDAEWTAFLIESGGADDMERDIAYNERENFWLLVVLPTAKVQMDFIINSEMVEYDTVIGMIWMMLGSYLAMVLLCAICYAQMTAAAFRKPFRQLCDYVGILEQGHYEKRIALKGFAEFKKLEQGMNHLAEELEKERAFREQIGKNRTQLIRDISHDLKNPLMGISGYAELCLSRQPLSSDQTKAYLQLIMQNSKRANELLMSLFDYAKVESTDFSLHKEWIDFGEFLRQEFINWLPELEHKNFCYQINIPEKNMPVQIDVALMKRVLSNLFSNTLKYNPDGTKLTLSLHKEEKFYEVSFADDGIGMNEKYEKSIFEPFSRPDGQVRNSHDGGSGLGLAIVKKIVELHGGEIRIETQEGKGTKFIIKLPV